MCSGDRERECQAPARDFHEYDQLQATSIFPKATQALQVRAFSNLGVVGESEGRFTRKHDEGVRIFVPLSGEQQGQSRSIGGGQSNLGVFDVIAVSATTINGRG